MFQCKNKRCILKSWLCDGDKDCSEGEDEPVNECAKRSCDPTYFKCKNNRLDISTFYIIDLFLFWESQNDFNMLHDFLNERYIY